MKIRTMDGTAYEGTALQIVNGMKSMSFMASHMKIKEYVNFVADQADLYSDVKLKVEGDTDEETASSLVTQLLQHGLLREGV